MSTIDRFVQLLNEEAAAELVGKENGSILDLGWALRNLHARDPERYEKVAAAALTSRSGLEKKEVCSLLELFMEIGKKRERILAQIAMRGKIETPFTSISEKNPYLLGSVDARKAYAEYPIWQAAEGQLHVPVDRIEIKSIVLPAGLLPAITRLHLDAAKIYNEAIDRQQKRADDPNPFRLFQLMAQTLVERAGGPRSPDGIDRLIAHLAQPVVMVTWAQLAVLDEVSKNPEWKIAYK